LHIFKVTTHKCISWSLFHYMLDQKNFGSKCVAILADKLCITLKGLSNEHRRNMLRF
jgi:hypothetical protein